MGRKWHAWLSVAPSGLWSIYAYFSGPFRTRLRSNRAFGPSNLNLNLNLNSNLNLNLNLNLNPNLNPNPNPNLNPGPNRGEIAQSRT